MYLKEREENGDFISSVSDKIWLRDVMKVMDMGLGSDQEEAREDGDEYDDNGFLKLAPTKEWLLGERSAPYNKKARAKAMQDNSDRRKKLNLLKYDALKRELLLLSLGIGTACSGYCLVVFSVQAAISYATGVLLSCLYLQLLSKYTDNITKDDVPDIFMKKKTNKIGIRTAALVQVYRDNEDLQFIFPDTSEDP
uniref:CGL160/ATPI domain-containing protein n=1 Tax=Kalanchoe fedtschenkoi TaxID=63787 RepID=A0A7N0RIS1_KALFE